MIVYVESNFVLEIAREQEEFEAAGQILSLAEERRLELALVGTIKAFAENPRISSELRRFNCRYVKSFSDGLSSIDAAIRKAEHR